jgi:hypothetical protein
LPLRIANGLRRRRPFLPRHGGIAALTIGPSSVSSVPASSPKTYRPRDRSHSCSHSCPAS